MSLYLITEGPNDGRSVDGCSRSHWNYVNNNKAQKLSRDRQIEFMASKGFRCDRGFALKRQGYVTGGLLDVVYKEEDLK